MTEEGATKASGEVQAKSEDLLSELTIKIYESPLSQLRESGAIADPLRPISIVMLVIDFETEVSMSGIADFIGNSTGRYANETVIALERIGCPNEAALLKKILAVAARVGMTHGEIQRERSGLAPFSVTSFKEVHGPKWDAALDEIRAMCGAIDFATVMRHAEQFVADHRVAILSELGRP
jgi:hypothetical protein